MKENESHNIENERPAIQIEHLTKFYTVKRQRTVALDDINLNIHHGEIFGIIGVSGAGKSTLVRCINNLERPSGGRVVIDGQDISLLKGRKLLNLRRSVSMIFQQFNLLLQRSALSNVRFPLEISGVPKKEARERAVEMLRLVGLADKANAYPSQLSGGQKQRVAIARALATNPKVLLSDEATSALDPATTHSILELLSEINRRLGITIVVITHQMDVVRQICTRVAVIDKSKIAEYGPVSEVLSNPETDSARKLFFTGSKGYFRCRCRDQNELGKLAGIVPALGVPVNILPAGTEKQTVILELSGGRGAVESAREYLSANHIEFEEETGVARS